MAVDRWQPSDNYSDLLLNAHRLVSPNAERERERS